MRDQPDSSTTQLWDGLGPLAPEQWAEFFPGHADSLEMVRLLQRTGPQGFTYRTLAIGCDREPVLLLPLFETAFAIPDLLEGRLQTLGRQFARFLPRLMRPKLLGIGLIEGEWGAVGMRPGTPASALAAAWARVPREIDRVARAAGADVILWANFTTESAAVIPPAVLRAFSALPTYPFARLPIPFTNLDGYLAGLSKETRKSLRRKLRSAADVRIVRTADAGEHLDEIHRLYAQTVDRSDLSFGTIGREFFARVGAEVPGAHYVLYFVGERLVAFNLLVERDGVLIDKYFAQDPSAGRERSLWFFSWMTNVEHCARRGLRSYCAGSGAEATKTWLGADLCGGVMLFRHVNPLAHTGLNALKSAIAYEPAVEIPPAGVRPGKFGIANATRRPTTSAPAALRPICLNLDGGLLHQPEVLARMNATIDLTTDGHALRLFTSRERATALRQRIQARRRELPGPWLTFFGSGDFHHVTLSLLEALPPDALPFHLVLVDRHPDWLSPPPRYHCGNWVSGALQLPGLRSATLIGQGGEDLRGLRFVTAPLDVLAAGKLRMFPESCERVTVPLRWPRTVRTTGVRRHALGTDFTFAPLGAAGTSRAFESVARSLAGRRIYLSVDKDCLDPAYARTNWDQGRMTLDELADGIRTLSRSCLLVGADVCGDRAPSGLRGIRRFDAGPRPRLAPGDREADALLNQRTNLKLLDAFGVAPPSSTRSNVGIAAAAAVIAEPEVVGA